MNRSFAWSMPVAVLAAWMLAGCNDPPPPLRTPEGKVVEVVELQRGDEDEVAAVKAAEAARADYKYRLDVLRGYYDKIGNQNKYVATGKELDNLKEAQYFRFLGIEVQPPRGESVADADERLLVEETVAARNRWLTALDQLGAYYRGAGAAYQFKARLVENVLARFGPVHRYKYFLEAEIPGPELRPAEVIPQADQLYARAHKLYEGGKGALGTFVTTDYAKERQALVLFRELIDTYPRSTKIALAAYFVGEIYKEYFNEDVRAVKWYERAWQWDPHVTEPARFQAATVYDARLHNPEKAIELYKAAITDDPWRVLNREHAKDRIEILSKKKRP